MANYQRWRGDQDQNWNRDNERNQWRDDDRFGGYGPGRETRSGDEWRRGQGAEGASNDWNRNVAYGQDRDNPRDERGPGNGNRGGSGREFGRENNSDYRGADRDAGAYGYYRSEDYRERDPRPDYRDSGRGADQGRGYGNQGRNEPRDFWNRASDEVSSWFGDNDAERRRQQDQYQGEHRGRGPKGYTRSDERIREDINDRLSDDSWVDASEIEVTVANREVTLTGNVDSRNAKRRAEDIAEQVSGVNHVSNNLRVKSQAATGASATGANTDASTGAGGLTSRRTF